MEVARCPILPIEGIFDGDDFGPFDDFAELGQDLEFVSDVDPEYTAWDGAGVPVRLIVDACNTLFVASMWRGWRPEDLSIVSFAHDGEVMLAEVDVRGLLHRALNFGASDRRLLHRALNFGASDRRRTPYPSGLCWAEQSPIRLDLSTAGASMVSTQSFSAQWLKLRL